MNTTEYLINKYGLRMTFDELAKELRIPVGTLRSKRFYGGLNIKTYSDEPRGRIYADCRDVAAYLDSMREAV
jgi:hypothetical protein